MKKQFRLLNMHCAGCADALEHKISEVSGVNVAQVNYITKILTLEVEKEESEKIIGEVMTTITHFDRMIKVEDPSLDASDIEKRQKRKKIITVIVAVVLLALGLVFEHISFPLYIYLPCYLAAYGLVGYNVLWSSARNIIHGKIFDENFLMSVATIGALAIFRFSEAVMVMLLYQIGELLQDLAVSRSRKSIESLLNIKSNIAHVLTEDGEIDVSVGDVRVGAIICIKPGENVPLDAVITSGASLMDTSAITGESKPFEASEGSEILSGSINGEGVLLAKVTKEDNESTASKIVEMVEEASTKKAKTENFISRFARIYTPLVCVIALMLVFVPCFIFGFGVFNDYLYRGLIFLVVSCPCALVISIPLGFFAGLGSAARSGILIRGGNYIEALNNVKAVIFDKTGTLTTGQFSIDKIYTFSSQTEAEVLEFVAYAENYSNHRIARSLVEKYTEENEINGAWIEDIHEEAGLGVSATVFMTPILVKENAAAAINSLKDIGIKEVAMFTGDNLETAKNVANRLHINNVYANLMPADKVGKLDEMKKQFNGLAFVGDGINDAPVLSTVDVGIAMGGIGSDAAVAASDVVLMTDDVSLVTRAILIARKTHRIVMENVIFAIAIKIAVLLLSALGLGAMWLAVFADVGVSIIAVLNALRALAAPKIRQRKLHLAKFNVKATQGA